MRRPAAMSRLIGALALAGALAGLSACTTTGHGFNSGGASRLEPGVSTYADAVAAMGALPMNTYQQRDGTFTAHWYVRQSVLTDAIYRSKEAYLLFGPDGRFLRLLGVSKPVLPDEVTTDGQSSQPVPLEAQGPSSSPRQGAAPAAL